jgi:Tfp pilus assembly protein PilO
MSGRRSPIFAALIVVALAVALFFLLVFPKMGEVRETEDELEQAQREELTLQTQLASLQEAREQAPEIQRQLARLRRQIPPVADLPGVINELQDITDVSGVDFFAISPGQPTPAPQGQAAEIPAQVQVVGTFFPVDEFLFRLETLPRASKVTNVAVTEGPDGLPQIQVTLDVRFYTTDLDAGPGATPPGSAEGGAAPAASPSPGASPTPATSPTAGTPVPAETPGA